MRRCLLAVLVAIVACGDDASAPPDDGGQSTREPPEVAGKAGPDLLIRERPGYVGVVVAKESFDVAAKQSGEVEEVAVRIGDRVDEGDLLVRLDRDPIRESIAVARAQLAAARADLSQAEFVYEEAIDRLERRRSLEDSVATEDLRAAEFAQKKAEAARQRAAADVAQRKAELDELESDLADAHIRAPFAGTVAMRFIDPGVVVTPGTPMVRLVASDELWVRFAMPAGEAASLTPGDRVGVRVESLSAEIPAVVRQVAPELDPASQMILVEAELDPDETIERRLQSGLAAWVE